MRRMSMLGRVAMLLVGSAAVFVACAADKAADRPSEKDSGILADGSEILDSLLDSIGVDVDPAKDVAADIGEIKPGSRLRPRLRVVTGADGSVVKSWAGTYWDDARKEECQPYSAADGKTRCLPAFAANPPYYFSDATCTTPLYYRPKSVCGSDAAPVKYVAIQTAATCGSTFKLYPITSTLSTWTLYLKTGTTCTLTPSSSLPGDAVAVGAEVPASDFVELTTTYE